jgi:hypothetical protein
MISKWQLNPLREIPLTALLLSKEYLKYDEMRRILLLHIDWKKMYRILIRHREII